MNVWNWFGKITSRLCADRTEIDCEKWLNVKWVEMTFGNSQVQTCQEQNIA